MLSATLYLFASVLYSLALIKRAENQEIGELITDTGIYIAVLGMIYYLLDY